MNFQPFIFAEPPKIPSGLTEIVRYKLEAKAYKTRITSITSIFLELIATILVLGVIWINVDWVRAAVTGISILLFIILYSLLSYFM